VHGPYGGVVPELASRHHVRNMLAVVKIRGQVLAVHPGFGMGVRFTFDDDAEREEMLRLLALLATGPTLDELPR
jgi:hypothetical protein